MLSKLFGAMHTKAGQMLISIILGIGLIYLEKRVLINHVINLLVHKLK